jgi:holo-[acyl-carrier protein] synthase
MILGTGIDMVEIERVARSIERYGSRFLERVYTPAEIAYCQRKRRNAAESFAARFAAKEAAAKALGTGIGFGVTWREMEVGREPAGRPVLLLHGRAAEIGRALGVRNSSLSITHTGTQSMALVILEG